MKIKITNKYKSIPKDLEFELPDFSVITGKNGSGKTHLLEALSNDKYSNITSTKKIEKIKLIKFGELNPSINEICTSTEVVGLFKGEWNLIKQLQEAFNNLPLVHPYRDDINYFLKSHTGLDTTVKLTIETILEKESLSLNDITEDHVYRHMSISKANSNQLFSSDLAKIFKTYQTRLLKNEFQDFLNKKDGGTRPYLAEDEFINIHGEKPWELVNKVLSLAGLSHKVIDPEQLDIDSDYKLKLIESSSNIEISANDLSTGEKVLMSLALAIYNTQDSYGKPELLILDEPDAPLHPEYSKLLIDILNQIVVKEAGVKVIITTHSPSTVALCPDNCLYEIDKATKTPSMISVSKGIEILTSGIPHLKVSIEERRQIFVESKYDVQYFERLYNIVKRDRPLSYTPIFLEPHSGTSNCSDVISIVTTLSDNGSDLARGIIDWDGENNASHPNIRILGNSKRYSIENYILDPLFIGLSLIREKKKSFADFSLNNFHSYVDASKLTVQDAQIICDFIITTTGLTTSSTLAASLQNGWILKLPESFTSMRGHDWEELLKQKIPEINALIAKQRGDSALKLQVMTTIEEFPQYLSIDIFETLNSIQ